MHQGPAPTTTPAPSRALALSFLAIGVLSVGAAAILIRLAHEHPLTASFSRLALGGACLVVIAVVQRRPFPRGANARRAVVAGLFLAAHFALWISSLSFTSVTASVVLVCLQPVFVIVIGAAIAAVVGRSSGVGATVVVGVAVAVVGAVMVAVGGGTGGGASPDDAAFGNALALAGAIAIAAYVLVLGGQSGDVIASSAVITVVAAVAIVPVAVVAGAPLWPTSSTGLWWLLALAIGPQVIGHTALNAALRTLPPAVVSGSILLEPVIASALAVLFLRETAAPLTLVGGAVTIAGVFVLTRQRAKT